MAVPGKANRPTDLLRWRLADAAGWVRRHPGLATLAAVLGTGVLYQVGLIGPLDWWGSGAEVGR